MVLFNLHKTLYIGADKTINLKKGAYRSSIRDQRSSVSYFIKAQDLIVNKDGSIVKAKVLEVSEDAIKYKKISNLKY